MDCKCTEPAANRAARIVLASRSRRNTASCVFRHGILDARFASPSHAIMGMRARWSGLRRGASRVCNVECNVTGENCGVVRNGESHKRATLQHHLHILHGVRCGRVNARSNLFTWQVPVDDRLKERRRQSQRTPNERTGANAREFTPNNQTQRTDRGGKRPRVFPQQPKPIT